MKLEASRIVEAAGGRYLEAAIMSPINPRRAASPMLLGQIRFAQQRYADAVASYSTALELSNQLVLRNDLHRIEAHRLALLQQRQVFLDERLLERLSEAVEQLSRTGERRGLLWRLRAGIGAVVRHRLLGSRVW